MSTLMPSKPSEPAISISLSKGPVLSTNAVFLDTFAWTEVLLLKLPVERNQEVADMTVSMATTTVGRRRGHIGERKCNLRCICTLTRASQQSSHQLRA